MIRQFSMVRTREGADFLFNAPEHGRAIGFTWFSGRLGSPCLLTSDDFTKGFVAQYLDDDNVEVDNFNICQRLETSYEVQRTVVSVSAQRFKKLLGGNIFGSKLILTIFKPAF